MMARPFVYLLFLSYYSSATSAFLRLIAVSLSPCKPHVHLFAVEPNINTESSDDNDEKVVTGEMFMRDLLADPVVRRPGRKGSGSDYKVMDNRDVLPYVLELATPDPYTHPSVKKKNANKLKKRKDTVEERIASSLYSTDGSSSTKMGEPSQEKTLLGEYALDKHTTTGDLIRIGEAEYRVVQHRCLYKCVSRRFVMVKKILHVKEIGRIRTEEYLLRQLRNSEGFTPPLPEELC
jgi:hypothetical protein